LKNGERFQLKNGELFGKSLLLEGLTAGVKTGDDSDARQAGNYSEVCSGRTQ